MYGLEFILIYLLVVIFMGAKVCVFMFLSLSFLCFSFYVLLCIDVLICVMLWHVLIRLCVCSLVGKEFWLSM